MRNLLAAASLLTLAASPAFAVDTIGNVGLNNVQIGAGAGQLGNAGLNNSASLSASRISATTSSTTRYGANTNQNPAGNNGQGGLGGGYAETTVLQAGGSGVANTSLSGTGTLTAGINQVTNQGSGALGRTQTNGAINNSTLNGSGTLNGSFQRTATSNAATGLNGVSYAQTTGPGFVTNTVNGSAIAVGAGVTGAAGLR